MDRSDTSPRPSLGRGRSRGRGRGILSAPRGWGRGFSVTDANLPSPAPQPQTNPQPSQAVRTAVGRGIWSTKILGRGDARKLEESSVTFPRGRGLSLLNASGPPAAPVYLDADFVGLEEEDDVVELQFHDSDSDDDLMAIGRQLRHEAPDSSAATGNLSAFARSGAAAAPPESVWPKNDPNKVNALRLEALSQWRRRLRESSVRSLGPVERAYGLLEQIRLQWRQTGGEAQVFSAWFLRFLRDTGHPYQTALIALNGLLSNKKGKGGADKRGSDALLVQAVVDCLKSADVASSGAVSRDLRSFAFFLMQREGLAMARELVVIFRLNDDAAEAHFGEQVDKLVEGGVYLQAGQLIGLLNLHRRYSIEKVMLPLIAENRLNVVEDYMEGHEDEQKRLLLFLDQFHDKPDQLLSFLRACRMETLQLKNEFLSPSFLKKLAFRLQKKFHLPNSSLPTLSLDKSCYDLANIVNERYVRRLDRPDWEEKVMETVGDLPGAAKELVRLLMEYRVGKAARYWAQRLSVPTDDLPGLDTLPDGEEEEEAWEMNEAIPTDDSEFLTFTLNPRHDIEVVDNEDSLWAAISTASVAEKLGFDMEWTTPYGSNQTCVSILQMALHDCVYILDVTGLLLSMETDDAWIHFREKLLENPNICKLFYSAYQDLLMLWRSVPVLASPASPGSPEGPSARTYLGVVDLEEMASACTAHNADFLPHSNEGGLSGLVSACLGRPLDKSQRLSNWQRRPLSSAQLVYAALDAHCLISVHDWMEARKEELELTALDLRAAPCLQPPEKKKKKGKAKTKEPPAAPSSSSSSSPESRGSTARPASLLLTVDPLLQEAGEVLRTCGCHVEFSPVQKDSGRTLVSTAAQLQLVGARGVAVDETASAEKQAATVLTSLEVHLLPLDFVADCLLCGSRDFVGLSSDAVSVLDGDTAASMSARELKRLMKRGVDVESRSVVQPGGGGEKQIRCPDIIPEAQYFFICRSCGRLTWVEYEDEQLINNLLRLCE